LGACGVPALVSLCLTVVYGGWASRAAALAMTMLGLSVAAWLLPGPRVRGAVSMLPACAVGLEIVKYGSLFAGSLVRQYVNRELGGFTDAALVLGWSFICALTVFQFRRLPLSAGGLRPRTRVMAAAGLLAGHAGLGFDVAVTKKGTIVSIRHAIHRSSRGRPQDHA